MERCSRGRIVRRRLPARVGGGEGWLSPESAHRYWTWNVDHPKHSRLLMDVAVRFVRPGDVIWDIGANCGVFATACADLSGSNGSVLAIEPDTTTAKVLHMNAAASPGTGRAAIDVLECAVSDCLGTGALSIANRGRSTNYLASVGGRSDTGGSRGTRRVVTVTLDWLAAQFRMPSLMKIDVEGAEAMVIRGGMRVLRDAQPVILCEVGDDTRAEVCEALSRLGYTLSDAEKPEQSDGWRFAQNILAIPPGSRFAMPSAPAPAFRDRL